MDQNSFAQRVRNAREDRGLTQAQLGRAVGLSQQSIDAIESGRTKRPGKIYELAKALGKSVDWLLGTEGASSPPVGPAGTIDPMATPAVTDFGVLPRDIPVVGIAVGGDDADFHFNGETIDYVRRPPGIASARGVFSIYVVGTSMYPRFNEGDPVYVTAARTPLTGDDVIVELHPDEGECAGKGFIKRLVKRTPTKIVVEQFNPPMQIEFDLSDVKQLLRIIPWTELVG